MEDFAIPVSFTDDERTLCEFIIDVLRKYEFLEAGGCSVFQRHITKSGRSVVWVVHDCAMEPCLADVFYYGTRNPTGLKALREIRTFATILGFRFDHETHYSSVFYQ